MNERIARIVVGVDGSAAAQRALSWAVHEARLRGAKVQVIHAWMVPFVEALPEPIVFGHRPPGPPIEEVYERLRQAAKDVLDSCVREALEEVPDVEVERELVEARPAHALLEAARDANLLVVGSRGRGGFTGLLLGSVSQQCVQHAPCPVAVVPSTAER